MQSIDYNKETNKIYFFENWIISVFTIDMKFINEIKLNINFSGIEKITHFKYIIVNNSFEIICRDYHNIQCFLFDINGHNILQKTLSNNRKEILLNLNNDNFIEVFFTDEHHSYDANCKFYKDNKEILSSDLHDELEKIEKDWYGYEYIECLKSTNVSNQFSFITVHANYGVQGVKIYQINSLSNLDLLYDMDDLDFDGAFHNLTFNSKGEKFILLLYERDKNLNDYISICEYSIDNNKKPNIIFKTDFGYWEYNELFTHYLTDTVLCIVRNSDIILFDLVTGKAKEILNRDLNSIYFVDFNILIYQINKKMIVTQYQY
ncbi:MAG: hypothetical protein O9267_06330 [Flavobacterium sp.]|uniref:hypothetical protein n=1 Tax=Flavobacterium sp. TaxID=239 RepID=UPI0022C1B5B6|nr:hypothetical protein [Flavobacterium sp.]MCZ8197203.1 hypothetical protein [Flavobacterium sp.]